MRPDAAEYIEHGWALCQFETRTKGPSGVGATGWNKPENAIRDAGKLRPGGSVGLLHAYSGTCAIDLDRYQDALEYFEARGVNLTALLQADDAVQINSRPGRGKLLYRVPEGIDPLDLAHVTVKDGGGVILEFRCSNSKRLSVQDVLPPSIHKDTGKPYTWGGLGDWRELPTLPDELLTVWRGLLRKTPGQERSRGEKPDGWTPSAEVVDMVERASRKGCRVARIGDGWRGFCPVHGGNSGTSFAIDESDDGRALIHCFGGCSADELFAALGPADTAVPRNMSTFQMLKASQDARKAAAANDSKMVLPAQPEDLEALPYGLGELQAWILGFMTYPSAAMAGFTALATLAHFAMPSVKIDSRRGLGLNEQYLLLAPTGFGKEDLRAPFEILASALQEQPRPAGAGNLWLAEQPRLQFSAPASQQGLHKLLESHRAQTFLADEFAEWLCHAANDGHRMQALGHIMQAYGRAFSTLAAPAAVTNEYRPVEHPRVLIFATSTAERILETINASQADSGALNRFVIFVADQGAVAKRYDVSGSHFEPPAPLVDLVAWLAGLPAETVVKLDDDSRAIYEAHDSAVLDPLKFRDHRLAGRLNEQAFKIAALIALSDRRTTIGTRDLITAYAIREGLYHRAASLIGFDGALSGMHATGRALEQLRQVFESKPYVYRSNLPKVSRQFAKLSIPERDAVLRAIQAEGIAKIDGGRLVSCVHEEKAA